MIDPKLLKKIQKCLRLAKSANEHEAAAALAKAAILMEAHGLSEADLAMAEIEEATARSTRTMRPPLWELHLNAAVNRALGTVSFIDAVGDRTFVGHGPTAAIATYAYAMLFRQLKTARAEYTATRLKRVKLGRKRLRADIFAQGWANAVHNKVRELAPKRADDPAIEQYIVAQHPGLVPVDARKAKVQGQAAYNDWLRGHQQGDAVNLHHGVDAASGPSLLGDAR